MQPLLFFERLIHICELVLEKQGVFSHHKQSIRMVYTAKCMPKAIISVIYRYIVKSVRKE